jgi:hypothetical protein
MGEAVFLDGECFGNSILQVAYILYAGKFLHIDFVYVYCAKIQKMHETKSCLPEYFAMDIATAQIS